MSDSVSADPRIGTEIAGYRIERLLGRGVMSVVYLACHKRLDRRVAFSAGSVPDWASGLDSEPAIVEDRNAINMAMLV